MKERARHPLPGPGGSPALGSGFRVGFPGEPLPKSGAVHGINGPKTGLGIQLGSQTGMWELRDPAGASPGSAFCPQPLGARGARRELFPPFHPRRIGVQLPLPLGLGGSSTGTGGNHLGCPQRHPSSRALRRGTPSPSLLHYAD